MPGVVMPQKKPGLTQQAMPLAGAVVGTKLGGPIGGAVGGAVGEKLSSPGQQPQAVETAAMQRRLDAQASPLPDLVKAEQAVASLPPEQQQAYGPQIRRARVLAEQERGMV